ncbi:ribulokinase [Dysgonomonas mossii]|uniref:ribulokinase n=1 Tax=Dysgonomonas mossii TaxID=163665 RepID=UPI0039935A34
MYKNKVVIGVDYGTDSCRALVVDAITGEELGNSVQYYPRWKEGLYCDPQSNRYRQHPLDYTETLESAITEAISRSPQGVADCVVGMAFDMTGSTPVLTNKEGLPIALMDEFKDNPNAMFILWKDHTAVKEAEEINNLAKKWDIDYTAYEGGIYSSEWVWAKVMHILRNDEKVCDVAYSWIEHTDWIPALLTGNIRPEEVIRSRCSAGHKAMWHESWGGLPDDKFLTTLSPYLQGFRDTFDTETYPANKKVGSLSTEWAQKLGLSTNVAVAVGAIDCHVGAVGANIKPKQFVRVMGTSTCDIMVVSHNNLGDRLIDGICGQVDGSVLPNMIGLEAGQSAFGDVYAWFKSILEWPLQNILDTSNDILEIDAKEKLKAEFEKNILKRLTEEAQKIDPKDSSLLATDWLNGRRTPYANQNLKGTITGLTLGTTAPMIFRTLVEATAFGSKSIVNHFIDKGLEIEEVVAIGGISQKSSFVMQILADVLNMPIKVTKSEQTCALGACMFAAVAGGVYTTLDEAQLALEQGVLVTYHPCEDKSKLYNEMYQEYLKIGTK